MKEWFLDSIPNGIAIVAVIAVVLVARIFIQQRYQNKPGQQFRRDFILLLLSFIGLIIIIISLPIKDATIGQLLSLLGILVSAAIALSATTFVGNIMAGMMLRLIKNFKIGDFVRVGDSFGRISERGLFHIEIQTEDRDLTTMPNLYLVTQPVKVIRSDGTIVSAEVSLGYDVPQDDVKKILKEAALECELTDPFVLITELGDFSITYRLNGLLENVKGVLSKRSELRGRMLDHLHRAGVEIVSPTFMNQRQQPLDKQFIPAKTYTVQESTPVDESPEAVVFDKADEAESFEKLVERHKQLLEDIKSLKDQADANPLNADMFNRQISLLEKHSALLLKRIESKEEKE